MKDDPGPRPPWLDGQALDASKLWAAAFMVTDHVGAMWYHRQYPALDAIGRISFPLFAYAAAAAVDRTTGADGKVRAVGRLLMLGVLVEPVSQWARGPAEPLNVLFTLAMGTALAGAWTNVTLGGRVAAVVAAWLGTAFVVPIEFGLAGLLLPALLRAAVRGDPAGWLLVAAVVPALNLADLFDVVTHQSPVVQQNLLWRGLRDAGVVLVGPWAVTMLCRTVPSSGRILPKYFLHVFYPAHLVLLRLLA